MPKISVVMPAWNAARTLRNAINSIRTQTFKNWELIIVDDGSTDDTKEVVKSFKDSRIKYIHTSHEGLVAARNTGNREAKAPLIVIQDADDLAFPNRLDRIWKTYQKTKADVITHGFYLNVWDKKFEAMHREYHGVGRVDKKKLLKGQNIPGCVAFKKSTWLKKPFRMETQFTYDWMMHLDWVLSGFKYAFIDEPLYEYIRYENSASIRFEKEGKRAESYKKIKEILKNEYHT